MSVGRVSAAQPMRTNATQPATPAGTYREVAGTPGMLAAVTAGPPRPALRPAGREPRDELRIARQPSLVADRPEPGPGQAALVGEGQLRGQRARGVVVDRVPAVAPGQDEELHLLRGVEGRGDGAAVERGRVAARDPCLAPTLGRGAEPLAD